MKNGATFEYHPAEELEDWYYHGSVVPAVSVG